MSHYIGEICIILQVVCSRLRTLAVPNNQKASPHVILTCTQKGRSVPHFISFRVVREEQVAGLVPEAIRCLNDAVTERHQPINIHLWSLGHLGH